MEEEIEKKRISYKWYVINGITFFSTIVLTLQFLISRKEFLNLSGFEEIMAILFLGIPVIGIMLKILIFGGIAIISFILELISIYKIVKKGSYKLYILMGILEIICQIVWIWVLYQN